MYHKEVLKEGLTSHLVNYGRYLNYHQNSTFIFEKKLHQKHGIGFYENLANSSRLDIDVAKKKLSRKNKVQM
jgi:hypothetical protein